MSMYTGAKTVVRTVYGNSKGFEVKVGMHQQQQQQRPFNGLWSGTTRVGRYQKELSPTHTYPNQRASFVIFLHLQRSMACLGN